MNNSEQYIISDIYWDRIWVFFRITPVLKDAVIPEDFRPYIINTTGSFKAYLIKEAPGLFKLNITNPGNCRMLPTGRYSIAYQSGNTTGDRQYALPADIIYRPDSYDSSDNSDSSTDQTVSVSSSGSSTDQTVSVNNSGSSTDQTASIINSGSFTDPLASAGRRFVYFHSEREYRIDFTSEDNFGFTASDGVRTDLKKKKKLKTVILRLRHRLAKIVLKLIYYIFYIRYKKLKKRSGTEILIFSDQSETLSSNLAALKKALIREGYNPDESLRAITTKHYSVLHWIKTLRKLAKADFIFMDDHSQTMDWLTLKNTVITQTWHAGAGFKSTGYSRFGMKASPAPKSGHRQYTYGLAGSRKIRHFFSEVWGINETMVLPTGMPRLDEFLDDDFRRKTSEALISRYPLLSKRVILFAPTYRGENKKHAYYPYNKLDFDELYRVAEASDSVFVFKMHPFINKPVPIPERYRDRMLDLSAYPNINDLFYVTDLLITDYSSNIYEFSLMRKPILFYAFDIDGYSKSRGFHRDYRSNVPGKITETFEEMCDAIISGDFEYEKVEEYIKNNFEQTDTHACDRIIDWIVRGNLPDLYIKEMLEEKSSVIIS